MVCITMTYCQSCGHEVQKASNYCSECGGALDTTGTNTSANGGSTTSKKLRTDQLTQTTSAEGFDVGDTDVIGRRITAVIIDVIIPMVGASVLAGVIFGLGGGELPDDFTPFLTVFAIPTWFLYHWLLEAKGQTIGKKLVGIEVRSKYGGKPGLSSSFVRNILRLIDGLFYYLVGIAAIAASEKSQRLGDKAANTVVIRAGSANRNVRM